LKYRDDPKVAKLLELAFGKRPAEELYDLRKDTDQLSNVAALPEYAKVKNKLAVALMAELRQPKTHASLAGQMSLTTIHITAECRTKNRPRPSADLKRDSVVCAQRA